MSDPGYTSIEDYVDVEARNAFIELLQEGREADEAFRIVHAKARDNARTPMQWDASTGAGFTDGTPWLRPTDQAEVNGIREEASGRILPYYKRLIALRKTMPGPTSPTPPTTRTSWPTFAATSGIICWSSAASAGTKPRSTCPRTFSTPKYSSPTTRPHRCVRGCSCAPTRRWPFSALA